MSIESTAPASPDAAQTTPAELQNGTGQIPSDGAGAQAGSDPSGDASNGTGETPEHRKASYRFSEMSKQNRELQLKLARMEGMLSALQGAQPAQAGPQNAEPQPAPAPMVPPQRPNPADFPEGQYDPNFHKALADYADEVAEFKARKVLDERSKAEAERAQKEAERRAFEQGQQRFNAVYDQAEKAGATGATQVLEIVGSDRQAADLLMNVTHPVETADWLAENQDWLRAIMQTRDPVQKGLIVGRIDQHIASFLASQRAQSSAQSATPAPTTQAAPGPQNPGPQPTTVAQPTVRAGTGGAPFNPATASFRDYEAWRRANPQA